jgi:hypothetical protein
MKADPKETAALAAVPVGDDVEERALLLEMDAETLDRAKLGGDNCTAAASLLRSLAASLAAVTAERDEALAAIAHNREKAAEQVADLAMRLGTVERSLDAAKADRNEAIRQRDRAVEALLKCRTAIGGYAITSPDQYPKLLEDFLGEIRRVDHVARTTLAAIRKEPTDG